MTIVRRVQTFLSVLMLAQVGAPLLSGAFAAGAPLPLIPMPEAVSRQGGSFVIRDGATIGATDSAAMIAAWLLADRVLIERGLRLRPTATGDIRFERDSAIAGDEADRLTIETRGIRISASGDAGWVHGARTLAQLLSPDLAFGKPVSVPGLVIDDAPRFRWRGVMLDVARHFEPLPALYAIVDQMAAVKLNTLHIHLSDDQGWRVLGCLRVLRDTDAGTGYIHEAFDKDDPATFTRRCFAWANGLFGELIVHLADTRPRLLGESL